MWVTNTLDATVMRINPQTREIDGTISLGEEGDARPKAIAVSGEDVWVGDELEPSLWRIDAPTGRVVASPGLRGVPTAIAVGGGAVWVVSRAADLVARIDPETGSSSTLEVGDGPAGIAVWNGWVWVTSGADGTVRRIDAATFVLADTIDVGGIPEGVAVGSGDVWVAVQA